jgi:hypothetical protein
MTLLAKTSGSKANNAQWFTTALSTPQDGVITIHFATPATPLAGQIRYTLDDGANWVGLSPGGLSADTGYEFRLHVTRADKFNIRQQTGVAMTVTFCHVLFSYF